MLFGDFKRYLEESGFSSVEFIAESLRNVVFKAVHPSYGVVAIKMPKFAGTLDKRVIDLYRREVNICKSISHPHIVIIRDLIIVKGIPAIIEEYCPNNLRKTLSKKRKLSLNEFFEVFIKILKAVVYLHSQDIAHGDIKPENILFTEDGEPKLSDLETAKIVLGQASASAFTMEYVAPEQLNRKMTLKTDVYQLAVVAYEMLTGKPYNPLSGEEPPEIEPEWLNKILRKCLKRKPEERPDVKQIYNVIRTKKSKVVKVEAPVEEKPIPTPEIKKELTSEVKNIIEKLKTGNYDEVTIKRAIEILKTHNK
ncbi:MAG: hypothetical protein B6U95_02395 [Thermofilum sp. ex4484_82]|nr:MAG: hypothetical protein B6U95_02395 [Thermofilum sp. ex4484_82]OYT39305.1 MAG: hypothetical protein B6U96_02390 [Archaeoglobales archaeon ex4484_92]